MTMKIYYWQAMKNGEIQSGMYTEGTPCMSAALARMTAKPIAEATAYALIEHDEVGNKVIIDIEATATCKS